MHRILPFIMLLLFITGTSQTTYAEDRVGACGRPAFNNLVKERMQAYARLENSMLSIGAQEFLVTRSKTQNSRSAKAFERFRRNCHSGQHVRAGVMIGEWVGIYLNTRAPR
jgi:hypothetical protein